MGRAISSARLGRNLLHSGHVEMNNWGLGDIWVEYMQRLHLKNILRGVTVMGEQSRWFTLLPALLIHPENKEKWQVLGKNSTYKIGQ